MNPTASADTGVVARIVARSRSVAERIARPAAATQPAVAREGELRLERWRQTVARGDALLFGKRLAWDGWDSAGAAHAVAPAAFAHGEVLPSWAETFRYAYGETAEELTRRFVELGTAPDRAFEAARPLPFEELFRPLLALARERVAERAGAACAQLTPAVHAALERALLQRLSHIAGRALYAELSAFRAISQQTALAAWLGSSLGSGSRDLYQTFLERMVGGGLLSFFEQYSVAARLCATVVELWVDALTGFLSHLGADLDVLQAQFGAALPLGRVASVQTGISDPHQGGRSVWIVQFEAGVEVVYKPRSLALESFFAELLAWLGAQGELLPLRTAQRIDRGTHGWLELVEHLPCADEDEVSRFFVRSGMLLGLTYALNGSDFHFENVIASGEHPVLIDLEALLTPRMELQDHPPASATGEAGVACRAFEQSVLKLSLLPTLKLVGDQRALDIGGITGAAEPLEPAQVVCWENVNTDAMRITQRTLAQRAEAKNLPRLRGAAVDASAHVNEIATGFERMYRCLLGRRSELLAPTGLLSRLQGCPTRFLFRHSSLYAGLIERGLHPRYLCDGTDRSIELDVLARPLLALGTRPEVWSILRAEHSALEQLDLPFFTARSDSRGLQLPSGEEIDNCFGRSAYEEAVARLASLDEADLARQRELIRGAFAASAARGLRARESAPRAGAGTSPRLRPASTPMQSATLARACALATARRLEQRALRGPGTAGGAEEIGWLEVAYLPRPQRSAVAPSKADLMDGYGGIALFLAALARTSGDPAFRTRALSALAPLLAGAAGAAADSVLISDSVEIGAGTGMASTVYSLVRAAALLDEPALLEHARRYASHLTLQRIEADRAHDVIGGSAGALLGMLALAEAAGDDGALQLASACGARLLAARALCPTTGLRVWHAPSGRAETGFAHGQAGIAYALLRCRRACPNDAFVEAAREAMAYERQLLGADLAGAAEDERCAAWSHGATGIGLARLGTLDVLDEPAIRADIEAAIRLARAELFAGSDDLCCGSAARIELLLSAGLRLDRPELVASARAAADSLARRVLRGRTRTSWPHGYQHNGLFRGQTGISYELLRVTAPEQLPSLSIWA